MTSEDKFSNPDSSLESTRYESFIARLWDYFKPKLLSFNIGHLLLILFGLHLFAMSFPNGSSDYIFDECYYVGSCEHSDQNLLNLIPSNLEHPFFAKIWGAFGIYLFGDNFFGWRIFYVIIGVLIIWVFYELALVFFSKTKALFAASLLGFETLLFIHTTAALLEGPPLLFGLLGFLLYFKKRYYLSALAFGLSILSKEWGVYFVFAVFLYHLCSKLRGELRRRNLNMVRARATMGYYFRVLWKPFMFALIVAAVVCFPLWIYDLLYHPFEMGQYFTSPLQNFLYYYSYHTSLKIAPYDPFGATCNTSSALQQCDPWHYAWFWIDPFTVHPDSYYVVAVTFTVGNKVTLVTNPIDYLGMGNLVIWYSIWAIIPCIIIAPILRKKITELEMFVGIWIFATYLPSLFLSGVFHRVVYAFYFVNVDPGLALGIPLVITLIAPDEPKSQKILMAIWLGAAIVFFILFFPIHPGPGCC